MFITTAVPPGLYVASVVVHGADSQIYNVTVYVVRGRNFARLSEVSGNTPQAGVTFQITGEAKKLMFIITDLRTPWEGGEVALFRMGPIGYGGLDGEA